MLLLHGLCGSAESAYMQTTQRLLHDHGYDSVAMNFRGCSGQINSLARAYHSGATDDVGEVIEVLQAHQPRPIVLVGFSLGANVTLRYLFENPSASPVVQGIAISTPFQLAACSKALERGLSRAYGFYFKVQLVNSIEDKKHYFRQANKPGELAKLEALGDLTKLKNLWDFDDKGTAILHGFENAHDYYSRCSSGNILDQITSPVHLIQSVNDPFIPSDVLPSESTLPPNIILHLCDKGGHVGFTSSGDKLWLERQILNAVSLVDA